MNQKRGKIVYVAMSGGVDSSVAALALKKRGYSVVGVYMRTWSPEGEPCPWKKEKYDAMRVCAQLDIPYREWNFTGEYKENVVNYMLAEYERGRTPNPDVVCNRQIKFGLFFDRALAEGADFVATGHYVRSRQLPDSSFRLIRAKDLNKDQSYFLWTLTQRHLARTLFPIGEFKSKEEVRAYAVKHGLATAKKKDSQGVCFIGPIDVGEFLRKRIPANPGPIVTVTGRVLGQHDGLAFYTIGQRQGIGAGGGGPYYVAQKESQTNTLVVAPPAYEEALLSNELTAEDVHWIAGEPADGMTLNIQIRYRQTPVPARVWKPRFQFGNGVSKRVIFEYPVRAVTPGQSIVFYDGERVLGGGIIK